MMRKFSNLILLIGRLFISGKLASIFIEKQNQTSTTHNTVVKMEK